jgi:hypothetical protein
MRPTRPKAPEVYGATKAEARTRYADPSNVLLGRISWCSASNARTRAHLAAAGRGEESRTCGRPGRLPTNTDDLSGSRRHDRTDRTASTTPPRGLLQRAEFARGICKKAGSLPVQPDQDSEYPSAPRGRSIPVSKRSLDEAGFRRLPP